METEAAGGSKPALVVHGLSKRFGPEETPVRVLDDVAFDLRAGESVAVTGPSGSGKSTLLHLLGTLDTPTSGTVRLNGTDPFSLSELELARFRNRVVGFVFQDHHLLPQHDVLENVLMPTLAFGRPDPEQVARARELLERVGLSHRLGHRPGQLSGGECQRAAVARALIHRPRLLLGDEPTGSLDQATADAVADLLFDLHRAEDTLLVVVTHHPALARRCDRVLELRDGRCVEA